MPARRFALLFALAVALTTPDSRAAAEDAVSQAEIRATLDWFGGLGLAATDGKPFVRFTFGGWTSSGIPKPITKCGFLLAEDATSFRVVTPCLDEMTLTRTPKGTPAHEAIGFEPLDLHKFASDLAESWTPPAARQLVEFEIPDGVKGVCFEERVGLLVLARACDAAGEREVAEALVVRCANERESKETGIPLRKLLVDDVACGLCRQATMAYADVRVPRKELLVRWRRVIDVFPGSGCTEWAKRSIATLEPMVAEDAAHEPPAGWPEVAPAAAVREWIWRLRDQHGEQDGQPGSCLVFLNWEKDVTTPAHQLHRLGYEAVPALIEALDDERPTRSVGYVRDFFFSHEALSIGEAARQVLERIAGRGFWGGEDDSGEKRSVRAAVEAWWTGIQKLGPEQSLVEAVSRGDRESLGQAEILVERFPASAFEALVRGAHNAKDPHYVRPRLVQLAGGIPGDAVTAFLLAELASGPALATRLAAADELQTRGRAEGVDAMVLAWRGTRDEEDEEEESLDDVIRFLARCGEPRAIDALRTGMDARRTSDRIEAVTCTWTANRKDHAASDAWRAAAERLFVERLSDREAQSGMSMGIGDVDFSNPRVCDVAATALIRLRGSPDSFPLRSSASVRDRACVALANTWRVAHDLPPLPLPDIVAIPPADAAEVARLLGEMRDAADTAHRDEARARIAALGLGARAAVESAIAGLPSDAPSRADTERLANDIALIVRTADTDAGSPAIAVPEEAASALAELRGRPLRSADLVRAIVRFLVTLPADASGIELAADRPEDGTGFTVSVKYRRREPADSVDPSAGWGYSEHVVRSGDTLLHSGGSAIHDYLVEPRGWEDFAKNLDRALSAGPREPIEVRVGARRGD